MTHEEIEHAYRQYGHLVLRRCQRILRGAPAAEDVLQEVFVRLWRYGDAYRAAESKLPWLYRVADRCCFDHLQGLSFKPGFNLVSEQISPTFMGSAEILPLSTEIEIALTADPSLSRYLCQPEGFFAVSG